VAADTEVASAEPAPRPKRASWVDTVSAVLLAVAAVGTAWCSYQASRWNGEQAKAFSAANAARVHSSRSAALANAQKQVDVAVFMEWVNATAHEDEQLADFYQVRFRAEFIPAFEAWLATDPFGDPDAPLTPFTLPEYRLAAQEEADRLDAEEAANAELAKQNIERSTRYVLGVVLFAISLFFAGISTKLATHRLRAVVLVVGCVFFLATAIWVATFPKSIAL
jgi:hypothetical protein